MYMPQPQGEQYDGNNQSNSNKSKNSFIQLIHWLFQQAYDNRAALADLLYFLVTMYSVSLMMRPVYAAKPSKNGDDQPIDEFKEPYCEKNPDGTDYCYERNAKVFLRDGQMNIQYTYNKQVRYHVNPGLNPHPRFQGRQPENFQNPGQQPLPNQNQQHENYDPMNRNNFFDQGAYAGAHPQHLQGNVNQRLQRENNDIFNANERLRNNNRR